MCRANPDTEEAMLLPFEIYYAIKAFKKGWGFNVLRPFLVPIAVAILWLTTFPEFPEAAVVMTGLSEILVIFLLREMVNHPATS
jgi:hypothetical protein